MFFRNSIGMPIFHENFTATSKNTEVLCLSEEICHDPDFYFCWSSFVEFTVSIKLVDQEYLTAVFAHAMTSIAVHKENKLVRIALEKLMRF